MAENETTETTEATETDIFQQQKKVIDTLVNELARQAGRSEQIIYTSPTAERKVQAPNYLLYGGLILAVI